MPICEMCGKIFLILYPLNIVTYITRIISTPPEHNKIFEIHTNKMICQGCLLTLYKLSEQRQLSGEIEIYDCSRPE